MVGNRFISFGCSYTGYVTATWADYIGANFKEYYNFGQGGASNTFIMNRFIEVDNLLKFNINDYIVIMFTNFDRYSYRNESGWRFGGNVYKTDEISKDFVSKMWSTEWSIYQSWISMLIIKKILTMKNIKHKILTSMDNTHLFKYINEYDTITGYLNDTTDMLDVKIPMWNWAQENYKKEDFMVFKDGIVDTHPTQKMHYDFVKEYFPEFDTMQTKNRYELSETAIDNSSIESQYQIFAKTIKIPYNLAYQLNNNLFL